MRKSLNMLNFNKYDDSLNSLNIGTLSIIKEWLYNMKIINYLINKDYTIDVNGDVDISYKELVKIPKYITFGRINGSFLCNHNKLKSLKGCPIKVGNSFYCNDNLLITLEYGPKYVGGSYIAHSNNLKSLKGIPEILNTISCNDNLLKSLKYLPEIIHGNLYCNDNLLNNLFYIPKNIKGNLYIDFRKDKYGPKDIRKKCYVEEFIYMDNKINSKF